MKNSKVIEMPGRIVKVVFDKNVKIHKDRCGYSITEFGKYDFVYGTRYNSNIFGAILDYVRGNVFTPDDEYWAQM